MYYLLYGLLYLLSLLPLRVLFLLSDFLYFLLYYVAKYRIAVVDGNLTIAFPNMKTEERERVMKQFYHNFVDSFVETVKILSASRSWLQKHFLIDPTVVQNVLDKGKKVQIHLGHNFNWELANVTMPMMISQKMLTVYMPVKAKAMDKLYLTIRGKTGAGLLPATTMRTAIIPYRNSQYVLVLVADQNPGDPKNAYWLNFFGRPTPFVRGPERGARIGDIPVVFANMVRLRRGYYQLHFELAEEFPSKLPEGELTRRYIRFLERAMTASPDLWLWSHRRWKHSWKPEYKRMWIDTEAMPR
jgi:Kdo2-lipid IVA lauroyltransferase/acyltransferase